MKYPMIWAVLISMIAPSVLFCQEIVWQDDIQTAKNLAHEQDKLVLLHFQADWCRPCKQLETFVFRSSIFAQELQDRLIPVRINTDLNPDLVKQYEISEIPYDVVLSASGKVVEKRRSPRDVDNYLKMIRAVVAKDSNTKMANGVEHIIHPDSVSIGDGNEVARTSFQGSGARNDFATVSPSHAQPNASRESLELAAKISEIGPEISPVAGASPVSWQSPQTTGAQRVVNDTFIQDHQAYQPGTNGEPTRIRSNDGSPTEQSLPIANAEILTPSRELVFNQFVSPGDSGHGPTNDSKVSQPYAQNFQVSNPADVLAPQVHSHNTFKTSIADRAASHPSVDTNAIGLDGKCPVTLIKQGRWQDGDPQFGCIHRGRTYLFANVEHRAEFQSNPELYSPILAGYDPVLFHERGELVEGSLHHGVFMGKAPNQRIILFQSAATRAQFQSNPEKYLNSIQNAVRQADQMTTGGLR